MSATKALTQPPPVHSIQSPSGWVVWAALIISILNAIWNIRKESVARAIADQESALEEFEQVHGEVIRQELRNFQTTLMAFRALTLPSALTLAQKKLEIDAEREKWESASYDVQILLAMAEKTAFHEAKRWVERFREPCMLAETQLESVANNSVCIDGTLNLKLRLAQSNYEDAIAIVNKLLQGEKRALVPRRKFLQRIGL